MATAEVEADKLRPCIVVLPFAQQGHINPLMHLAKALANRGAQVTFVVSENMVPKGGGAAAAAGPAAATPNVRLVGLADNLPAERSRGSSFSDSVDSMVNMEPNFAQFLAQLARHHHVSALIYDAFMTWAPPIAASLSIPCFCFFTTNATACCLGLHVPSLIQRGVLPFRRPGMDTRLPDSKVQGLEGVPDLLPEEFPVCLTFDASDLRYRTITKIVEMLHEAPALIINTMEELEPAAIATLRAARKRVFSVGPLLLLSGRPSRLDITYWPEDHLCLPWLDAHTHSSVLYVSFGSVASFAPVQFQELALGLEASEQPFLWIVRPDSVNVPLETALPNGFLDRTKDRGLIISWGPQLSILSHPSVGGFFTHGGWNSIIENLSLNSVPMICWPHVAEQPLNCHLMVNIWNISTRLNHKADGSVTKEEIARVVRDLFHGKQGVELKNTCKKVGDVAKKAISKEGSSQKNFDALHDYLTLHIE